MSDSCSRESKFEILGSDLQFELEIEEIEGPERKPMLKVMECRTHKECKIHQITESAKSCAVISVIRKTTTEGRYEYCVAHLGHAKELWKRAVAHKPLSKSLEGDGDDAKFETSIRHLAACLLLKSTTRREMPPPPFKIHPFHTQADLRTSLGPELFSRMESVNLYKEIRKRLNPQKILGKVRAALADLHDSNWTHRDLCMESVLLTPTMEIRLTPDVIRRPEHSSDASEHSPDKVLDYTAQGNIKDFGKLMEEMLGEIKMVNGVKLSILDVWLTGLKNNKKVVESLKNDATTRGAMEREVCLKLGLSTQKTKTPSSIKRYIKEEELPFKKWPFALDFTMAARQEDPSNRPTAKEARFHPFFDLSPMSGGKHLATEKSIIVKLNSITRFLHEMKSKKEREIKRTAEGLLKILDIEICGLPITSESFCTDARPKKIKHRKGNLAFITCARHMVEHPDTPDLILHIEKIKELRGDEKENEDAVKKREKAVKKREKDVEQRKSDVKEFQESRSNIAGSSPRMFGEPCGTLADYCLAPDGPYPSALPVAYRWMVEHRSTLLSIGAHPDLVLGRELCVGHHVDPKLAPVFQDLLLAFSELEITPGKSCIGKLVEDQEFESGTGAASAFIARVGFTPNGTVKGSATEGK